MTKHKVKAEEMKRKHRKAFRVIIEIVFMTLGILCAIMPYPFPLLVPIGIGAIRIISNAVRSDKEPPPVVYCNGVQERHTKAESKTQTTKKRAATAPTQSKQLRQTESKQRRKSKAQ